MTDDIVARLRGHIAITTRVRLAKDGFPELVYDHGPSTICQEAADEIERLRAGGCARDQNTTQYCAEAVTLQREVEQLREALRIEQEELAACCIDRRETQRERDEARREVCAIYADTYGSVGIVAEQRGWDCFKENTNE